MVSTAVAMAVAMVEVGVGEGGSWVAAMMVMVADVTARAVATRVVATMAAGVVVMEGMAVATAVVADKVAAVRVTAVEARARAGAVGNAYVVCVCVAGENAECVYEGCVCVQAVAVMRTAKHQHIIESVKA